MLFTSFEFLIFLAGLFILYYLLPVSFQSVLLLAANIYFYAQAGFGGLIFITVTVLTSYAAVMGMTAVQRKTDDVIREKKESWDRKEKKAYKAKRKSKKT